MLFNHVVSAAEIINSFASEGMIMNGESVKMWKEAAITASTHSIDPW
jgi:hypothetical protein